MTFYSHLLSNDFSSTWVTRSRRTYWKSSIHFNTVFYLELEFSLINCLDVKYLIGKKLVQQQPDWLQQIAVIHHWVLLLLLLSWTNKEIEREAVAGENKENQENNRNLVCSMEYRGQYMTSSQHEILVLFLCFSFMHFFHAFLSCFSTQTFFVSFLRSLLHGFVLWQRAFDLFLHTFWS